MDIYQSAGGIDRIKEMRTFEMKRVCSLLLIILTLSLVSCSQSKPTWQEQYDLGVRYLSEGNYEEAIIAFTAAIEIEPKRAEAYLGLADAYIGSSDYEKAAEILQRGQDQCGDLEGFSRLLDNITFLQSNETGIRITDFYFDKAAFLTGNETDFQVSVVYRCPEDQACILMIGANTEEPDSFRMMDEDYSVTGSGRYQFRVTAPPVQWENANFGIYVNLSEADHADTWTPLGSDALYINREGDMVG